MKTTPARVPTRAFIHPLLLTVIAFGGATGLGVVWARQQIAATANHTSALEKRLAQAERDLAELGTALNAEQSVSTLERRNTEWQLGLVPPREPQVVRVAVADEQLRDARRGSALLADLAPAAATRPAAPALSFALNTRPR